MKQEMMERESLRMKRVDNKEYEFTDMIFSWSIEDILNEDLYEDLVDFIELSFRSVDHYFTSYVYPLLEETRAQLSSSMETLSNAPFAEVSALEEDKPHGMKLYVKNWKNRSAGCGKEPYKTLPGDIFVLADFKPETAIDLRRTGKMWTFASVTKITKDEEGDDIMPVYLEVKASEHFDLDEARQKSLFVVYLTNIIPNKRIWNALHMYGNLKLIKKIVCAADMVKENCDYYSLQTGALRDDKFYQRLSSELNNSQKKAICACLSNLCCNHKSTIELIWGPPGTGKTKTLGTLLFALLKLECRILACAPTNVAIKELASRVLSMARESFSRKSDALSCSAGDMLLFGNHERLKVGADIQDIYLDYRVKQLTKCFAPSTGWNYCFTSMIDFLENCVSHYLMLIENELIKGKEHNEEDELMKTKGENYSNCCHRNCKYFLEFVRESFVSIASPLKDCISILCTHIARSYILEHNFWNLMSLIEVLDSFQALLFQSDILCKALEVFSLPKMPKNSTGSFVGVAHLLYKKRIECLSALRILKDSLGELKLPNFLNGESIKKFCFQTSSLIFSTASSSYKLHSVAMKPLNILVIDEASQLKECESVIPLLLPGISHAILVGDECQLPAMVESKVSYKAGFGRSLFERLSSLNHPKHLLNIQYRMHPAISFFPNWYFYSNQILNAPNVARKDYEKQYLPWPMFGPYSFINVVGGREEFDDAGRSRKNMVEVAVVMKIVKNLHKVWLVSKEKLCIGIVSPYSAQVVAIQEELGQMYDSVDGFEVNVKSVDGFQGGGQDIIILSTVKTNCRSSLEFISSPQRCNVALTRARHGLWILGNERTLASEEKVWKALVLDAKNRQCFFNADDDKDLAKAIVDVKKELDQFDDLLDSNSVLFRNSKWKVLFSGNFVKSFKNLWSNRTKMSVLHLLLNLSSGWRPKRRTVGLLCGNSSQILKQFKVEGLYVVCSIDIVKESRYTQVLKIWDILSLEDIPKLAKRLDAIYKSYTDDFISRCEKKRFEGKMEVPMSWENSAEIIKSRSLHNSGNEGQLSTCASGDRSYVENSKVEDSLLLMKFYSLSFGVVSLLLSDRDGKELDIPFEVTDEEREIILFPRSTFVLGRSGTGKTTILTMKLFQKENLHRVAVEAACGAKSFAAPCLCQGKELKENTPKIAKPVLHQLFVTVCPKLCQVIKHHVNGLKRSICGGNISAESITIDEDIVDTSDQFKNLPDSFIGLPPNSYPLVVTFHKFLMMLDGTLGNSYFERFHDLKNSSYSQNPGLRSVALETFMRRREVNYDRFFSSYWPHFNSQLTKKLDSSRVFTEITSHIKGGIQASESEDGRLSRKDYVNLSKNRASSLSSQRRELIYDIYMAYEKRKTEKGEFDLADIVNDLHGRLRTKRYEGDEMQFIYIDEVQDLTMTQLALFKYICQNVDEGFVFSGDTSQTIARGIDFKFQDIRSLFYEKFVLESRSSRCNIIKKEKGKISNTFLLSQNFRTHAGVLNLSQSIIELLYRFFPHSIDVLKPETSSLYGEPPVVLESRNRGNAIVTIFGNSGKIVGFGAEQVILVRDDSSRNDIKEYVRKHALVLTILECKGLEFQDVLLYNFFGSSPLRNKWRMIYEYMKEQDLLDNTTKMSYPSFSDSKHNVLCSELKQLYVAVTRTRQRLWICENTDEFSKPMFDYWKKKCLVQTKELDDSLAQAMMVGSSPEEWKSRGRKLYDQNNYKIARVCFEKAGDPYWEKKSKASDLKATANCLDDSNPEGVSAMLREAAEIFEGIGMVDSAAQCFSDVGDHERAGKLYLENCEEPDLKRAGDCFYLAKRYDIAAQVFARGSFFSDCLNVCAKGRLFDIGLGYIQNWKHDKTAGHSVVRRPELDKIEQKFLESCAEHYLKHKDTRSMMKFVKAFHSMDLKRDFLRSVGLLNELLLLEEESENFMEAANIAKQMGDIILEADQLEKAGKLVELSELSLFYVLANSLWSAGSKGWPLKGFEQKREILTGVVSLAKKVSCSYYELVSTEADILSNEQSNLFMLMTHLNSSRRYKSIRGEILCLRKLLDAHFQLNSSKYVWQDELIFVSMENVEGLVLKNQFSVETLFYSWNSWKEKILHILEYLSCLKTKSVCQHGSYGQFALNYLGVRRQIYNRNDIYLLLIPDAFWVTKVDGRFMKNGRLESVSDHLLVSDAQSYWCSELLSVGMDVLHNLEALYKFSVNEAHSIFCKGRSLILIYEVSKFLLDYRFLTRSHSDLKTLENFFKIPIHNVFGLVVPVDWQKSQTMSMVSLRGTEACQDFVKEVVYDNIRTEYRLTYGQIGRVAVMILGMGQPREELCVEIMRRLDNNPPWKAFIRSFNLNAGRKTSQGNVALKELQTMLRFYEALKDTYNVNWMKEVDYLSPSCFMYLIERLLILTCCWKGLIFSTKCSFIEWLIYQDGNALANLSLMACVNPDLEDVHKFIGRVLHQLLYNQNDTIDWIRKSKLKVNEYFPLLVLRLVVSICLLHLSTGKWLELIYDLLGKSHITEHLPSEFYNVLRKRRKHLNLEVFAEAFKKVDNNLVIARLWNNSTEIVCPDAVFVDLMISQNRDDILQVLFPERVGSMHGENSAVTAEASNSTDNKIRMPIDIDCCWKTLEYLQLATDESYDRWYNSQKIKDCVASIELLISSITGNWQQNRVNLEEEHELAEMVVMLDELMEHLSATLSNSVTKNISVIGELSKRILSTRTKVKPILDQLILVHKKNIVDCVASQGSSASSQDHGESNLEASKENMGKASEAVISSGNGKRKKHKKNKGRK